MRFFRINIYLSLRHFFSSFFFSDTKIEKKIFKILKDITGKKEVILTSQLRTGFILTLQYLKKKYPNKNEIILSSYNLAEMVNICRNLGLKIIFPKLDDNLFFEEKSLTKKMNTKTLAVVTTNIFNTFSHLKKIKKICNNRNVQLIEDNAIYFGNFKILKNKKIFSGSFGDFSLNSFNIMKNISAMYGGSVATNDKDFLNFAKSQTQNYKNFPFLLFIKQCLIFLILKLIKTKIIYNLFFFNIIKNANNTNNKYVLGLVYPSIKFEKKKIPNYYFTNVHMLAKKMIFLQLNDKKNFNKNHLLKKYNNIFYYKTLKKKNIKGVRLLKYEDPNFQNYNDFPIVVKNKKSLVKYLFSKGIETKTIQYVDCQNIFKYKKENLTEFENKILCLPNHRFISKKYIEFIVDSLNEFYTV